MQIKRLWAGWVVVCVMVLVLPGSVGARDRGYDVEEKQSREWNEKWWDLFTSLDLVNVYSADSSYARLRPRIGIDVTLPIGLTLGNEFSNYQYPYQFGNVSNTEFSFRAGWHFFDRRLQIVGRVGTVNTSYTDFSSSTHEVAGIELIYKIPLGHRFALQIGAGWTHVSKVTLTVDSAFDNAFCTIVTLGFASGCGNNAQITIPASSYASLGVGLGWVF